MSYSLDPAMPITAEIRAVATAELDAALRWLAHEDAQIGVHNGRKSLKRLRSLLALVAPGMPAPLAGHLQSALSGVGKLLAPARDAQALLDTVERLGKKSPKLASSLVVAEIHHFLARRREDADTGNGTQAIEQAKRGLETLRPALSGLTIYPDDFDPLADGLRQGYRDTRRAYRHAFEQKTDEALHDWRKQVQRHWRQMQLLTPCWPEALASRAERVHTLAQRLGEDHDLANLRRLLSTPAMAFGDARETKDIAKRCQREQKALRAEAKALGSRLFAEKPRTFTGRIAARWAEASTAAADAPRPPEDGTPSDPDGEDNNVLLFETRDPEWRAG